MPQHTMFALAPWIVPAAVTRGKRSGQTLSDPQTVFGKRPDCTAIEVHCLQPLPTDARPCRTLGATLPVGQASHEKAKLWRK
jgi:hypothetical protein